MPYILQDRRKDLAYHLEFLAGKVQLDKKDGELNYIISRLIDLLYARKYSEMNAALGVLEAVKQEYYRQIVAPYEDIKKQENGEVY